MRGKLRFVVTALTWAVILLAIYALTARAQTCSGADRLLSPRSGLAAQAGAPVLPVLGGGTLNKTTLIR